MPADWRLPIAIALSPQALLQEREREAVPITRILPCRASLETGLVEKAANAPIRELITILGVNRFPWHEVNVEVRALNNHILRLSALEVHLDPGFSGIPTR